MENETKKTNTPQLRTLAESISDSIKITDKNLRIDHFMNESLHTMGRSIAQPGMKYCGTIAIHLYMTGEAMQSAGEFGVSNITNITMKEPLSETAVATTLKHATASIQKHFRPRK